MVKKSWRGIALALSICMMASPLSACRNKKTSNLCSSGVASAADSNLTSGVVSSSAASGTAGSTISVNGVGNNTSIDTAAGTGKQGSSKAPTYSSKSFFNQAAKTKETKISINNKNIVAPSIAANANANSIIKRTVIEGVDGTFVDPKITESPRNLGGKTLTFATLWPTQWNGTGGNGAIGLKKCKAAIGSIQSDYNCKLRLKSMNLSTYTKDLTSAKSSGTVYANVMEFLSDPIITTGDLADLRNVKTVGVTTNQWNPVPTLVASFKGGVYGVGLRYDLVEHSIIMFNKSLAQKYNLGDFYGMVGKGQWTDDLFLQICQRFKKYNNDNSIYASEGLFPEAILDLVHSNDSSPFGITNKKYIFNGQDSSVLDILNYCQSFCKAGLYNTKCSSGDFQKDGTFKSSLDDAGQSQTDFDRGKILFYFGSDTILPDAMKNSKYEYGLLPLPKGPAADGYVAVIRNARYFSLFSGDPDIEDSGALLTALANRSNIGTSDILNNNASVVRDKQSLDTLTNNYKYMQILNVGLSSSGKFPNIFDGAALNCIFKQSSTPKQAMDSISNAAQAEINKNYGQ